MEPQYSEGSLLFVSKFLRRFVRRKSVVVAADPRSGRNILKRVEQIKGGKIYLSGDNSSMSTDSREFGPVEKKSILGKVLFKYPKGKEDWTLLVLVGLAKLGAIDASYLTYKHFSNQDVVCSIAPGANCDLVLNSIYSEILGIPLAVIGLVYYSAVMFMGYLYWQQKNGVWLKLLFLATLGGFITSLYLIYLQFVVLSAWCAFCLVSAAISTLLFAVTMKVKLMNKGR